MIKATIVLPTINEKESIEGVVEKLLNAKPADHDYTVIVVDDGSTDGTIEAVQRLAASLPVRLISRGRRLGLSSAVLEAAAMSSDPTIVVMDADGSHPPEQVPQLVKAVEIEGVDVVIGSRYVAGGNIQGWTVDRRFLSSAGTWLSSRLTGVRDPLSGFFATRRELLLQAGQRARGYKILLEILCHLPSRAKVREIPIQFINRVGGKSKMTFGVQIQFLGQILRLCGNKFMAKRR